MWGWIRMCLSFFFNKNLNSSILLFKSDDTVLLFRKKKKRASCTLSVFCFVCSQSEPWRLLARWFLRLSLAPLHSVFLEYLHHIHHPPCRVPRSPLRKAFTLLMAGFCLKLTRSPLAADSTLCMKSSVPWRFTATDIGCLLWLSVLSCLGFPGTYHFLDFFPCHL